MSTTARVRLAGPVVACTQQLHPALEGGCRGAGQCAMRIRRSGDGRPSERRGAYCNNNNSGSRKRIQNWWGLFFLLWLSTWCRHLRFFADVLRNSSHLWLKPTNYRFSSRGQPGDKSGNPQLSYNKHVMYVKCQPYKKGIQNQSAQVTMCENPICK
jgi:hypothetical protein